MTDCKNLAEVLMVRAETDPDRQLYSYVSGRGRRVLSASGLVTKAKAIAGLLENLNMSGKPVLLICSPGLETIIGFFGCVLAGAIAVPLPQPGRGEKSARFDAVRKDCGAGVVLGSAQCKVETPAGPGSFSRMQWLVVDQIADEHAKSWSEPQLNGSSLAFIQYTSGSTGIARGVMVSHSNVLSNAQEMHEVFALNSADRGVFWLPFYHDMGLVGGIIQPVYSGYPTAIMSPLAFIEEPIRWLQAISSTKATLSGGPNFAYDLCVQKIDKSLTQGLDLSNWRVAFNGSEPVRHETLQAFASKFGLCGFDQKAFRPCYGLAEATLLVSARNSSMNSAVQLDSNALNRGIVQQILETIPGSKSLVGAGEPSVRNKLAIVNPETRQLCAENQVGEIWISGPGVAQGYWKNPEDSKQTFQAKIESDKARSYLKTGDLGFVWNRQLFISGRLKELIIIRGQNFYPQDIEESARRSHPALKRRRGAAFSIEAAHGEQLIVVHEMERKANGPDVDTVVRCVREQIAKEHQVYPHAVVLIRAGTLPTTTSGKIQRKACREEFLSGHLKVIFSSVASIETTGVELVDVVEEDGQDAPALALVMRALAATTRVPVESISPESEISAFGIDSLQAAQIKIGIEKSTRVSVPISRLLQGNIKDLTDFVEANQETPDCSSSKQATTASNRYPLSAGQKALWYLQQLEPESPAYTIARLVKIRGPLNAEVLQAAFTFLVERHPSLRMVVSSDAGELWQDVAKVQAPEIEIIEAQGWDEEAIKAHAGASARQRFHLSSGPLLRLKIYLRTETDAWALLVAHHIVLDLWSLEQFAAELAIVYGDLKREERPALPPLQHKYEDFVRWQERLLTNNKGKELSAYWLSRMKDAPSGLALPFSQQESLQAENCIHHFQIDAKLSMQLLALSRKQQVTLHALLLAAFEVLLHRHTGQADFLLGLLSSGRNQQCTEDVIGYFVNLVVLRPDFSRHLSFAAYLQQSFKEMLSAIDRGDLPFSVLMEQLYANRQASRGQLVQATCILQPAQPEKAKGLTPFIMGQSGGTFAVGDLLFESTEFIEGGAQFDLTLVACNDDEKITAAFKYDPGRFAPEFIARLAERYEELLGNAAEDSSVPVGRVAILTKKERLQITHDWNNTACKVRSDVCIHKLMEEQVDQTPDHPAIAFEDTRLTYRELDVEANRLAHYLMQSGLRAESKVGVYLERSLSMVVAMLAIFKAGGAYVPLDPSHPAERIDGILKSSGVLLIITSGYLATQIKPSAGVRTISLDRDGEHISTCSPDRTPGRVSPENLAYVMYTSGSTGAPKGVMIEHRSVVNFFCGMDRKIRCGPEDTLLAVTSISFDISVLELLWPLTRGAQVIIVHDQALQPAAVRRVLQHAKQVQFSLFYFASADAEGAQTQYQMLVEGARLADQFGLAAVWTPERHFHAFGGLYPNPSLTNAALAMITSRIHLRAGSVVLPLHNPIRVAEEWALVDQLSQGRVGIAFASGWHADDFVLAPQNYPERKEVMYRGIETIQQLWRGGSIKMPGGAGNEVEIKLHPRPIQPTLPVWITSAGSADTFESAARIGANVLTHLLGQEVREVEQKIGLYRKELARQGKDPSGGTVTLMLHTYIDSDFDCVRRKALQPFKGYLRSSIGLVSKLVHSLNLDLDLNSMNEGDLDDLLTFAAERYMGASGLFGTPETCGAMIESVRDIGTDEIACLVDFGVDLASTMQSIRYIEELQHRFNSTSEPVDYSLQSQALRNNVTVLQCTPSLMRMLLHSKETQTMLSSLRVLLLGGEALPQPLLQAVRKSYQGPILNMYGPTETTIWSAVQSLESGENAVFIGGPIANTQIYILSPDLQHCPVQVTGELYIGGDGLARGYLGDPALTAQRFLPDPFSSVPGSRIYSTGDLGRFQKDGRIVLAGRSDQQVKIRGYRIELGDVDAALNRAPGIRTGIAVKSVAEEEELVGYLVPANDEIDLMEVRSFLRNQLPSYMIPGKLHIVDELPLTPNGKIDRASLLKVQIPHKPAPVPAAPLGLADGLAVTVLNIWKEVLKSEQISLDDNFFDIGGHSLLIVQVHERLQRALRRTFPLVTLLHHPTIRSITAFLEGAGQVRSAPNSELERINRQRNALLSQRNRTLAVRIQQ